MSVTPTLSALLVVKDEENRIFRQHLENIKSFCDEIIIVIDKRSTDNSYNICREYTDKVYWHEYKGIEDPDDDPLFFGIKYITSDWILLDEADFIFSDLLIREIKSEISQDNYAAFLIGRCNFFFGKWFTLREHWHFSFHLIKNGDFTFNRKSLHNREFNFNSKTGTLKNPLFHYGWTDITDFIDKINHYSSEDAKIASTQGFGGLQNRNFGKINVNHLKKSSGKILKLMYCDHNYYKEKVWGYICAYIWSMNEFMEDAKYFEYSWKKDNNWKYGDDIKDLEKVSEEIHDYYIKKDRFKKYKLYRLWKLYTELLFIKPLNRLIR